MARERAVIVGSDDADGLAEAIDARLPAKDTNLSDMMMATDPNCVFCKIVRGEIPCRKVYEDDDVLAFHDIQPQAPVHFMLIPKRHVASLYDVTDADAPVHGQDAWRSSESSRASRAPTTAFARSSTRAASGTRKCSTCTCTSSREPSRWDA